MLTSPTPTTESVARAAAEISDGTLGGALVEPWPRARSHHAFLLSTAAGQFLMRVHKLEHPGRMRRMLRVVELLAEHGVPHPRVRWWDFDRRTLPAAYFIQEFMPGEDGSQALPELTRADHERIGAEIGHGLLRMHGISYEDTPTPWLTEFDERMRVRVAEAAELGALSEPERRRVVAYYQDRRFALEGVPRRLTHDDLRLEHLLFVRRTDGWHFSVFMDFERTRGRDPLLDIARVRTLVFDACPTALPAFDHAYGELAGPDDETRARLELYAMYLLIWGVPWSRHAGLATREADYRRRLADWLTGSR